MGSWLNHEKHECMKLGRYEDKKLEKHEGVKLGRYEDKKLGRHEGVKLWLKGKNT